MLCRMAFCLSDSVVALYMDNRAAKTYLNNQSGIVSLFLSRLSYHILNVANKYGKTYFSTHTYSPQCWGQLSVTRTLVPEWYLIPYKDQTDLNFGFNKRWICRYPHLPINVSIAAFWKVCNLREPWGWKHWTILGSFRCVLYFPMLQ